MKHCSGCDKDLPLESFTKNKASKDGLNSQCRGCKKVYLDAYIERNRESLCARMRQRYAENPELYKARSKRYQKENAEACRKRALEYQAKNLSKVHARQRAWASNKRRTDVQFKIRTNLRRRLNRALKGKLKAASAVRDLGCTVDFLRQWLESKFSHDMSWENYGTLWHIDHVKPLTAFDLTDEAQASQACKYTNLQPLLAAENIRKGGATRWRDQN